MCVPSVVAVAEAWLFFSYLCSTPEVGTCVSQRSLPSRRSYASIDTFVPPSRLVVKNRWSFQTMGDEWPWPGTVTFHLTFSVFDQVSTYPVPSTLPWPDGPRQRGQYEAPSPVTGIVRTLSAGAGCATAT